jgi:hypothetical protein
MYHQVCTAIQPPPHGLAETFRDWDEITEQLAESSRNRSRYVFPKVNAYGQGRRLLTCARTGHGTNRGKEL